MFVGIPNFLYIRWTTSFEFGGAIGYCDSYLEFSFRHFKVFRVHAMLHDAAGTVRAHSGKGSGYCQMIGRGPISCLFGHVSWLVSCLHVKLFMPSIFNSFDKKLAGNCLEQWMIGLKWASQYSSQWCKGWTFCKRNSSTKEIQFARVTQSHTRLHYTALRSRQNCFVTGQCSL